MVELVGRVCERAADIRRNQAEQINRRRCEAFDPEIPIEENGRDIGRGNEVLEVAIGPAELPDFSLQLEIHRAQLLVGGLQPFHGGLVAGDGFLPLGPDQIDLLRQSPEVSNGATMPDRGPMGVESGRAILGSSERS